MWVSLDDYHWLLLGRTVYWIGTLVSMRKDTSRGI